MMNQSSIPPLYYAIFGKRDKWELNVDTYREKIKMSGEFRRNNVLKDAKRRCKLSHNQVKWIECVLDKTLVCYMTNWSIQASRAIMEYTRSTGNKHIIAQCRKQGSNESLSGCIFYDIKTSADMDHLTRVIYHSTDLFKTCFIYQKKQNTNTLKPLNLNDTLDFEVIKALVYGLFARPKMCCSIRLVITEGIETENSPRCISEDYLIQERRALQNKNNVEIQIKKSQRIAILSYWGAASQLRKIAKKYTQHIKKDDEITNKLLTLQTNNDVDDWESVW